MDDGTSYNLDKQDILADDYLTEEETITVTRSQVENAVKSNVEFKYSSGMSISNQGDAINFTDTVVKNICKALGFSEK